MTNNTVQTTVKNVKGLTNNTQRVGLRLLAADGAWVPRHRLTRVPNGTSRVRDLRKHEFGAFDVECKSSDELNKRVSKKTYYYRIDSSKVSQEQLNILFPKAV